MRPGLQMSRVWFVACLASSEDPLTIQSSHQQIKYLEATLSAQHADLSDRDSEIARLKRRIEEAERANARKQTELNSALNIVASKDAEIANLRWIIAEDRKVAKDDRALMESRLQKLRKTRTRPTVSIHSTFCYFR